MEFDIWHNQYKKVEDIYSKDNWRVELNELATSNICVIYFSSNNIWYPNTEEAFDRSFVNNDYYEWAKYGCLKARKVIYVRDIYKSWYVTGINTRVNSVDKLIDLLKQEIQGMQIITVGSSAGGYMAVLMGCKLKAEYVLCFSAQFTLLEKGCLDKNPLLHQYHNDNKRNLYYDLCGLLAENCVPIYYIMPAYCLEDVRQYKHISSFEHIFTIKISTKRHGVPVLKCNLPELLEMDDAKLKKLYEHYSGKIVNPITFSIHISGIKKTFIGLLKEILRIIKKRKSR